jgi:nucleoside 2-deoxyribosyltransferase
MRRVVYLSGNLSGRMFSAAAKERHAATLLLLERGWDVLDPLRGREILSTLATPMDGPEQERLLGATATALVQRDEDDIARADVVMILTGNHPSWGTAFEWYLAARVLHKPVVVVGTRHKDHPWCKHYAGYFAETIEEAVEFLDSFLDRGYRLLRGEDK